MDMHNLDEVLMTFSVVANSHDAIYVILSVLTLPHVKFVIWYCPHPSYLVHLKFAPNWLYLCTIPFFMVENN